MRGTTFSAGRGGASLALECGLSPDLIKLQGNWRSDCYQRYLEPDLAFKFTVARVMGRRVQRGTPVVNESCLNR